MGGYGIVGGNLPLAAGIAPALDYRGTEEVTLCVFGDGAANQGTFGETLNLAALWKLPIVFMVTNNQFGMGTSLERHSAETDLHKRGEGFGVPGMRCDGMDVVDTYDVMQRGDRAGARGAQAVLVEASPTASAGTRWPTPRSTAARRRSRSGASRPDPGLRETASRARARRRRRSQQARRGSAVDRRIDAAPSTSRAQGRRRDFRGRRVDATTSVVRERGAGPMAERHATARRSTQALREELERDERVLLMGEDIGVFDGAFKVTQGLLEEFGEKRVRDTPISEETIVGAGVGAAMTGLRPVVEIMTINFSLLAMDQIVNHTAKIHYMFGGQVTVPMVIRTPQGAGQQLGPTHSHCLEALFLHVPGLQVAVPSTPADAKGLLKAAIRDDNPVVFIEHQSLYGAQGRGPRRRGRARRRSARPRSAARAPT